MYTTIRNPETGRNVNINSKLAIKILNKYLLSMKGGMPASARRAGMWLGLASLNANADKFDAMKVKKVFEKNDGKLLEYLFEIIDRENRKKKRVGLLHTDGKTFYFREYDTKTNLFKDSEVIDPNTRVVPRFKRQREGF